MQLLAAQAAVRTVFFFGSLTGISEYSTASKMAAASSSSTSSGGAAAVKALPRFVKEINPGFYNIRGKLPFLGGLIDAGTHMSLIKLPSSKYLVIDTISLDPPVKAFLDEVTEGGQLMEAVVATHPFHTLFFPTFAKAYPKVPYYGTPRHLRKQPEVPWAGSVKDVLNKWESEGVSMRIPAGAEFDDPQPEANHFNAVFVLHKQSKTIHVDDTVMFIEPFSPLLSLAGYRPGVMAFHPTMTKWGLDKTPEAPLQFVAWVEALLTEWDFDNICTAHTGNKLGGAKEQLRRTLQAAKPRLTSLAEQNRRNSQQATTTPEAGEQTSSSNKI